MSGGLFQLVAYGAQDAYLTGNPEITFFNVVYRQQNLNFALHPENHQPSGHVNFSRIYESSGSMNDSRINAKGVEIDLAYIQYLKSKIKENDVKAMRKLAEYYKTVKYYEKMLKYYVSYINNADINKLQKIIKVCRETKNIKQFGELGDLCLDRLPIENTENECPICFDNCGQYKTVCCNQYAHHNCVYQCNSCPFCRAKIF